MHLLALKLALGHFKQRPLSRLFVVVSVACILLINCFLMMLYFSFNDSLREVKAARYMTAYIEASVPSARESQVVSGIKKIPGVSQAELISKEAFVSRFSKIFPQMATDLSSIDMEAVPRYVRIKLKANEKDLPLVKASVEKLGGIESVELNTQRFSGVIQAISSMKRLVLILIAGMILALSCVLLNHFKLSTPLAEQVRKTLVLLGSKKSAIVLPFALEGAIEGGLGGVLAAAMILAGGSLFQNQVNAVAQSMGYVAHHYDLWPLAVLSIGLGLSFGIGGSLWVLSRVRS